jgi:hypothetical protein
MSQLALESRYALGGTRMRMTPRGLLSSVAVAALSLSVVLSPVAAGLANAQEATPELAGNDCPGTIAAGECTGINNPGFDEADQAPNGGNDASDDPCGCAAPAGLVPVYLYVESPTTF